MHADREWAHIQIQTWLAERVTITVIHTVTVTVHTRPKQLHTPTTQAMTAFCWNPSTVHYMCTWQACTSHPGKRLFLSQAKNKRLFWGGSHWYACSWIMPKAIHMWGKHIIELLLQHLRCTYHQLSCDFISTIQPRPRQKHPIKFKMKYRRRLTRALLAINKIKETTQRSHIKGNTHLPPSKADSKRNRLHNQQTKTCKKWELGAHVHLHIMMGMAAKHTLPINTLRMWALVTLGCVCRKHDSSCLQILCWLKQKHRRVPTFRCSLMGWQP